MISSTSKDLFKFYDSQPDNLQAIVNRYMDILESEGRDNFEVCKSFLVEVKRVGYTFDYGLDGAPFNLRRLEGCL